MKCPYCRYHGDDFYIDNRAGMMRRGPDRKIQLARTLACPECGAVFIEKLKSEFAMVEDIDDLRGLNLKGL